MVWSRCISDRCYSEAAWLCHRSCQISSRSNFDNRCKTQLQGVPSDLGFSFIWLILLHIVLPIFLNFMFSFRFVSIQFESRQKIVSAYSVSVQRLEISISQHVFQNKTWLAGLACLNSGIVFAENCRTSPAWHRTCRIHRPDTGKTLLNSGPVRNKFFKLTYHNLGAQSTGIPSKHSKSADFLKSLLMYTLGIGEHSSWRTRGARDVVRRLKTINI